MSLETEMRCYSNGPIQNRSQENEDQKGRRVPWDESPEAQEVGYFNSPMGEAIRECIHNEMHRKIMEWREIDGLTHSEIRKKLNDELDVDRTERQIGYIIKRYIRQLMWYCRKISG